MFGTDERGQAIQVGAILLFAFLVIGFASYQAVVVPQQNERAEFEHSQAVQEDITELRSAVLNSAFDGERPSIELRLGTRYPFRLFAINPGPVGGRVQTTDARSVDVSGVSDVCPGPERSRQLTYSADYGYLQNSPGFHVENTVSYRQYDGRAIVSSGQKLVNGERINLVPIRNEYSENGVQSMSVKFTPGQVKTTSVSDPTVTVPTQLSEDRWIEILDGEVDASNIDVLNDGDSDPTNDVLELIPSGDYTVICTPVGVSGDPPGGARASVSDGLGGDDSVNPAGSGSVTLDSTEFKENSNEIDLTFKNNADENLSFSRARIAFYYEADGQGEVELLTLNENTDDEFVVGDSLETVDESVTVPANGQTTITLADSDTRKDDLFEFGVEYSDGSSARYFVDVADSSATGTASVTLPNEITYVDGSGGDKNELQTIQFGTLDETTYQTDASVSSFGPKLGQIDPNDDALEVPFVNGNNNLRVVDENDGSPVELVSSGGVTPSRLGVGDVDSDGAVEVVYINEDNRLRQKALADGNPTVIGNGNGVKANEIAGVADFNGDGDLDLVYVSNNDKLVYFDDGSKTMIGPTPESTSAVGQPADFDGDGDIEIPYKSGTNEISYADESGRDGSVTTDEDVKGASLAVVENEVESSNPDVVYVADSGGQAAGKPRIVDLTEGTETRYADEKVVSGKGVA